MVDSGAILGSFRLEEQIGRGGMGVVWKATHIRRHIPAAIKLITDARSRDEHYRTQFRNEAQAIGRMHHQGIVTILDYGESPELSDVGIAEGSPYLAMEWAPGGTLADIVPIREWPTVRDYLLETLDALAHAHARGVIHRDLKPHNILVSDSGALKLADFGLAHRREARDAGGEDARGTSGTPRWMAPEQIRGSARDQGPWTDLYALGCVVFWMLTYRSPYQGDVEDILRGHLNEPIPRLKSRIAIPHDFESWLRRMLAKDPNDRYRFAADASRDLLQFSDDISAPEDDSEFIDPHETDTLPEDLLETELFGEPVGLDEPSSYAVYETSAMPVRLQPQPKPPRGWVRGEGPTLDLDLVGASLGLWGIRAVPLVDRNTERDALWSMLHDVARGEAPRIAVLRGAAGTGKSRLAEWLIERAHEVGAAHGFSTSHSPVPTPQDGVPGLAMRMFRAHGLDASQILGRIRGEFNALQHEDNNFDALSLTELIESTTSRTRVAADARERWWAALARFLDRLSADRPTILWFDDVQWGPDSLGFVDYLLERESTGRALVVVTLRDEALAERPVESARLESLVERGESTAVDVAPLAPEYREELVRRLLRLTPKLAAEVADRTAGNPLFAVQLVDDWVQRGILELGPDGFDRAEGSSASLPDDIRTVWESRIARFVALSADPEATRDALEIAAALGLEVLDAEWRAIATVAGVDLPANLVDELTRAGLGRVTESGWTFAHGMLREAIEGAAAADGRNERWHSLCADFIRDIYGSTRETAERHAGHLIAAGRALEALEPLLEAAEARARQAEFDRVDAMFEQYESIVSEEYDGPSEAQARGLIRKARNGMVARTLDDADALLFEAAEVLDALDGENEELRGDLLFTRSRYYRHRGVSDSALPLAEEALAIFTDLKLPEKVAAVQRALGEVYRRVGQLEQSQEAYTAARQAFEKLGDDFQVGWCEFGLAATAKQLGNFHRHTTHCEASIAAFEQARNFTSLGFALNEKGEGLRLQQRYDEALEAYHASLQSIPSNHADIGPTQVNIGLTHLGKQQWDLAREWLRRGKAKLDEHGRAGPVIFVQLGMLACAVGEQRWHQAESLAETVLPSLAGQKTIDTDVARLLDEIGDGCEEHGRTGQAGEFWELAISNYERLGREDDVERISRKLEAAHSN